MTDAAPEDERAEQVVHDEPEQPEEYLAEGEDAVSGDTGTVYEGGGEHEPAVTPQDADVVADEDETA